MDKFERHKRRIIIIDDDIQLADLYRETLGKKNLGSQLIHLKNGAEGLKFLKNADAEQLPEYILLDLYMPEMDGFEFLERFSKLNNLRNRIEIYVCSSSKNKEDRDEVMNYPFVSAFLEKPLSEEFLEMLILEP